MNNKTRNISPAFKVIIIFGIISLLGDAVYESARGANSQYMNLLAISATKVGVVFGIGEFLGYFLRLISGILSDKKKSHWSFIILGYGTLIVVPLIGFTQKLNMLLIFILMERIGKALRSPAKDTVLSAVAENEFGLGMAFGIQEMLDQVGAFIGPLIFTAVFYFTGKNGICEYQLSYKLLFIPFILLMTFLLFAKHNIESHNLIKSVKDKPYISEKIEPIFKIYTAFVFFASMGFVNFSTVGYHLKTNNIMSDGDITLLYSFTMIADAVAALIIGKAYDMMKDKTKNKTSGVLVLVVIPILSALLPLLTLSNSKNLIIAGMMIFGIIMGAHETVMRSAIADIVPFSKRGTGYGIFNTSYGLALLFGASLMGYFYDIKNINLITGFTFVTETIAFILYLKMNHMIPRNSYENN